MSDGTTTDVEEIESGPTVFISYRRKDTGPEAEKLSIRLREDLGSTNVFRDEDDLIVGDRWQDTLGDSIQESNAAVFLVGETWPGPREDGTRRIEDQDDPVRNEVLQALGTEDVAAPLPLLVDLDEPPQDLPEEIGALFEEHHYASVSRASFDEASSEDYQTVLVGVWNALRRQVPRGVLVIGDRSAMASLDELVAKLKDVGHLDARHLSRFASGAYVASWGESRRLKKKYSDVIVNIESELTQELRWRLAAVAAIPGIKLTLVGTGAAAGLAFVNTVGAKAASTTVAQASTSQLVSASSGWVSSAWASAGVGAKVAAVATATAVVAGGAYGVTQIIGSDPPQFAETTRLTPVGGANSFPLGEPGPVVVRLGPPQPVGEEEAQGYFGNFPGGEAERRSVAVEHRGTELRLGEIVVPVSYPSDFLERNAGTFRLTSVGSGGDVSFVAAGAGAAPPCVYQGTGDTVGGWEYTGGPGVVSLVLMFQSDGGSVTDIGMQLSFEGPADVIFFEDVIEEVVPDDVNLSDRCTPIDRLATTWAAGVGRAE